jgi:hypothetical protein
MLSNYRPDKLCVRHLLTVHRARSYTDRHSALPHDNAFFKAGMPANVPILLVATSTSMRH